MPEAPSPEQSARLTVHRLTSDERATSFAQDVLAGLSSQPKMLPPKYFYDRLGSHLFEAICCLPEYYVTRDEAEILSNYADDIIGDVNLNASEMVRLIELGSGSSEKSRYLIEALLKRQVAVHYIPIDISETSLNQSCEELLRDYPQLKITAYAGDFFQTIKLLADTSRSEQWDKQRNVVLFLGSTLGNLDPNESNELLLGMRKILYPEDALVIGVDLKKSAEILIPAYADALGVTAAFNLNVLVRINHELGGNLDIARFEHRAVYNEDLGRMEMHLFSRIAQAVQIKAINLDVNFEAGESIHTENSYKFEISQLSALADKSGFRLKNTWSDSNGRFSLNLFTSI